MGFALAECLAEQGAEVLLISGPVHLPTPKHPKIKRIDVLSADEMFQTAVKHFPEVDGGIMSAAVADYKPSCYSDKKIKRNNDDRSITLSANPDIAAYLGSIKKDNQILVGFALETNNEEDNAFLKLKKKHLDFIVLNSLNDKGAGFGHDTNKISIINQDNKKEVFELKTKKEVAFDIVNTIIRQYEVES